MTFQKKPLLKTLLFLLLSVTSFLFSVDVFAAEPQYYNLSVTYPLAGLDPEPGDVIVRNRFSNTLRISTSEDSPYVFGVVAEEPAMVFRTEAESVPLMRVGQARVKVVLKNGDIEEGDHLTTSNILGYGKKVEPYHRYTLGMALESLSEEDTKSSVEGPDGDTYPAGRVLVDLRISLHGSGVVRVPYDDFDSSSRGELTEVGAREMFSQNMETFQELGRRARDGTRDFLESEGGVVASRVLSTGGAVVGAISSLTVFFLSPLTVFEIFLLPFRLWALLLSFFGIRRRSKPWGVVYDSVTKQPIDPAYVQLEDEKGEEVDMSITDIDGRYGFLVEPGKYKMKVNKSNYIFPSEKLKAKNSDDIYNNLYFGETFGVNEKDAVIDKNIPMDPADFDWNEFAKLNKNILKYYSYADMFKAVIFKWLFHIGFIVAIVALILMPNVYNIAIVGLYVFLFFLRLVGLKPRHYGRVVRETDRTPLSYAVVRVCMAKSGREVSKAVCDKYGRYFALASDGEYYVKIDRKTGEDRYENIYTSEPFMVTKGIIKELFKV
ncbi:MAG: carboxypeptidase-like regulatory domain-containing protein [Candidatus Paceibacterota bacterium]